MSEVLPSVISSAQTAIDCDKEVASFLDANRDNIRCKLKEKLPEIGYHGTYRLFAGYNEELLDDDTEYPVVFLCLDGDLEHDEEAISETLAPIFAPHITVLYTKSQTYDIIPPAALEGLHSDDVPNAGYPTHVTQSFYDSTMQPTSLSSELGGDGLQIPVDYKTELNLSFCPELLLAAESGSVEQQCTFGMKLEMTIKLSNNESGKDRPHGVPDWKDCKRPWYSLDFTELTIWSKNNERFSVSALHLLIEATPLTTGCEIVAPDLKHLTIGEDLHSGNAVERESTFDQWSIGTITYKRSSSCGAQEARVVEVTYEDKTTQVSSSVTHQLRFGEDHRPRVVFFSSSTSASGRSLRMSLKALWASNSTNNPNLELYQTPIILSNFFHQASFEINLEDVIRNKEFGKENIQLAPITYTVAEAIQDAIDEAKQHTEPS